MTDTRTPAPDPAQKQLSLNLAELLIGLAMLALGLLAIYIITRIGG